jgi:hypothetical protein
MDVVRLPYPQLSVFMARYANWHRGQVESLVPVGSNPTRATPQSSSRRLAARTPVSRTGWRRFESCRDDSQPAGLQVFRQHTSLVGRGTEFDSRADLRGNVRAERLARRDPEHRSSVPLPVHSRKRAAGPTGRRRHRTPEIGVRLPGGPLYAGRDLEGPMVQGDDVALAWRRSGFDSRWVHWNGR